MVELAGNCHMHTPYSDGEKYHAAIAEDAIKAGLDFVIVTDHNIWVQDVDGYYENGDGRVLLFTGEEVHNVRRQPQASHFLAFGAEKELSGCAPDPQSLIDETIGAGGFGFLAHPHEKDIPIVNEPNLGWHDWNIDGYTGLEIWNYMSSLKNRLAEALENLRWQNRLMGNLVALRIALNPERVIVGPEPETLELWDELLAQGKRIVAIGNSDAHGTPMSMGPIKREIYPYDFLFRQVNTHILTPKPLSGDVSEDKTMILNAIGQGNAWVGYDMPHTTRGFKFSAKGKDKGVMGDRIKMKTSATLQVRTPARANIRLKRHGEIVAEVDHETTLTYVAIDPGAYRVECEISFLDKNRGWIYSNPIYLY
ncbi:MAG: CehA/McbA family metallohydrolase [Candidatus Promineifilaceae bacterium]|nr:CehA/McbA family metallohydrolase [Candidatus Promineifilaceae bacterium]